MPVYGFYCNTCGHVTDIIVPVSERDSAESACERCGSKETTREIGAPGFVIHGYCAANGYASKNRFGTGESEAGEAIV